MYVSMIPRRTSHRFIPTIQSELEPKQSDGRGVSRPRRQVGFDGVIDHPEIVVVASASGVATAGHAVEDDPIRSDPSIYVRGPTNIVAKSSGAQRLLKRELLAVGRRRGDRIHVVGGARRGEDVFLCLHQRKQRCADEHHPLAQRIAQELGHLCHTTHGGAFEAAG